MTTLATNPYLDAALKRRRAPGRKRLDVSSGGVDDYLAASIKRREQEAPIIAANITDEQIRRMQANFPDALSGKTREEAAELTAYHLNFPHGTGLPQPETVGQTALRAVPRLLGGLQKGVITDPAINLHEAFAAVADAYGNTDAADGFRRAARSLRSQSRHGLIGRYGEDESNFATIGNFLGMLAPSAASLFVSGGANFPVLAYFGVQAVGGGSAEYRETLIAQGLEPDAIDALEIGVAHGVVEMVAEKLSLGFVGRVSDDVALRIGKKVLSGDKLTASRAIAAALKSGNAEGIEEALTQMVGNAIAARGLPGVPGYDLDRGLLDGVPEAYAGGFIGGEILLGAGVFGKLGRESAASKYFHRTPTMMDIAQLHIDLADQAAQEIDAQETAEFDFPATVETLTPAERSEALSVAREIAADEKRPPEVRAKAQSIIDAIPAETFEPDPVIEEGGQFADAGLAAIEQEIADNGSLEQLPESRTNARRAAETFLNEVVEAGAIEQSFQEPIVRELMQRFGLSRAKATKVWKKFQPRIPKEIIFDTDPSPATVEIQPEGEKPKPPKPAKTRVPQVTQTGARIQIPGTVQLLTAGEMRGTGFRPDAFATQFGPLTFEDAQYLASSLQETYPGYEYAIVRTGGGMQRVIRRERGELAGGTQETETPSTTKFGKIASEALERIRSRPGIKRGKSTGSTTLHADLADLVIFAVAKVIDLGARGAKGIKKALDKAIAQILKERPELAGHAALIRRNANRIIAESIIEGKFDEAAFAKSIETLKAEAKKRDANTEGTIRQRIERAVKSVAPKPTTAQAAAIVENVTDVFQSKIEELKQSAKAKKMTAEGMQAELVRLVRENLPAALHGRFLTEIRDVRTIAAMSKALTKMSGMLREHLRTEAIGALKKTLDKFDVNRLRPQFRDAVNLVLGDVRTKAMSENQISKLKGTAAFLKKHPEAVLPQYVHDQLDQLEKKSLDDLTQAEAEAAHIAILHALKLNDLIGKLIHNGRIREEEELTEEMTDELGAHLKPRRTLPSGGQLPKGRGDIWTLPVKAEGNLKPDTMAEYISGGDNTTSHRVLYRDLDDAQTEWLRGYQESMDDIHRVIEAAGLDLGSRKLAAMSATLSREHGILSAMMHGDPALRKDTKADIVTVKLKSGHDLQMTKGERMFLLASFADASTRDFIQFKKVSITFNRQEAGNRLKLEGEDIEAIIASATAEEVAIVNGALKHINGPMKDAIRAWSVERHGYDITKPDTYFPRHRANKGNVEAITAGNFTQQVVSSASIVQERRGGNDPIEIRDFFAEYSNLAWSTHAVRHMDQPLRTARKLLDSDPVSSIMKNSRGRSLEEYYKRLFNEIARTAIGGPNLKGPVTGATSKVVNRLTRGILAANPRVMTYQVASIIAATNEISPTYIAPAIASIMSNELDNRMTTNSPWVRARFESSAIGLINESGGAAQKLFGFSPRGEFLMRGISFFDRMALRVIWRANELEVDAAIKRGDIAEADRTEAVRRSAERVMKRTQPVFDALHLSGIGLEAKGDPTVKALTMFMAQRNQNVNMMVRAAIRAHRQRTLRGWAVNGAKVGTATVGQALGIVGIKELWEWILRGFQPSGDDDEDRAKRWMGKLVDSTISNFYFGQYFSYVAQKLPVIPTDRGFEPINATAFDPDISPLVGIIEDLASGAIRASRGIATTDDEQFWGGLEQIGMSTAALSGIPISPYRMLRQLWKSQQQDGLTTRRPSGR